MKNWAALIILGITFSIPAFTEDELTTEQAIDAAAGVVAAGALIYSGHQAVKQADASVAKEYLEKSSYEKAAKLPQQEQKQAILNHLKKERQKLLALHNPRLNEKDLQPILKYSKITTGPLKGTHKEAVLDSADLEKSIDDKLKLSDRRQTLSLRGASYDLVPAKRNELNRLLKTGKLKIGGGVTVLLSSLGLIGYHNKEILVLDEGLNLDKETKDSSEIYFESAEEEEALRRAKDQNIS